MKRASHQIVLQALLVLTACVLILPVAACNPLPRQSEQQPATPVQSAFEVADSSAQASPSHTTPGKDESNVLADSPSSSQGQTSDEAVCSVTITFVGDCTLGKDDNMPYDRSFNAAYKAHGPEYFLSNVRDLFTKDDITIVNMEGTLTDSGERQDKQYAFKGSPEYASVLSSSSVEGASVANNHSKDYGLESFKDTKKALESHGIKPFGYDTIAYFDVRGVTVACIGTYVLPKGMDIQGELKKNISRAADKGADIILVYFHWGIEREYVPNAVQQKLAHIAIDSGAHGVLGSHPHVIQGYEIYKGRSIVYSLGNFCFGGNSNPPDKDCLIYQETFRINKSTHEVTTGKDLPLIPCLVSSTSQKNDFKPTVARSADKERILKKLEESKRQIEQGL